MIPFGEYKPDVTDYETSSEIGALNVVARADGYGPFPSLSAISASLGAQCLGAIAVYKTDASVQVFAGTSTKLYTMDNTAFTWSDVSKGAGTYSAVSSNEMWQFKQVNQLLFATQGNAPLQVFTIGVSSAFADAAGSPPQARYIDVVGQFLVLTGLLSNPNRVQWSGLNDFTSSSAWTAGVNSSDFRDLVDGGFSRGIAGGETGIIAQDTIIRRMTYLPGDSRVFQIEKIAEDLGVFGPYSLCRSGSTVFFYSLKGFQRIDPGGVPTQIGRERVDRTFFTDLDASALGLFQGIADPRSSRILFAYKSVNGIANQFDKFLVYDTALDKFTPLSLTGECLVKVSQPGVTMEGLASLYPNLDLLVPSLDTFQATVAPELAAFGTDHKLAFFRGPNLEATVTTAELGTDGARVKMKKGFRVVTDAPTLYGSFSKRENLLSSASFGAENVVNATTGIVPTLLDARYARLKVRIPAGTSWNYVEGCEPQDLMPTGKR